MAQRTRFQSNSSVLDTLPAPPSGITYQLANSMLFAAGIAASAFDGAGLPTWAVLGIHAGGFILVATTSADLLKDYVGDFITEVVARVELRFNDHLKPQEPEVRFIPLRHGGPTLSPLPAQPPTPTQTIDAADFYNKGDLL